MQVKLLASAVLLVILVLWVACIMIKRLQRELFELKKCTYDLNQRDLGSLKGMGNSIFNARQDVEDLGKKVAEYRQVTESVLKQEVEIQKGINATNEKLLDIISAAGEIERGRAEMTSMHSDIEKRNELIEADIRRLYRRVDEHIAMSKRPSQVGIDWGKPINFTCSEGLTPEEIRALGLELGVIDVDSVTKNLHEKCNTAEEVGECTDEKS